MSVKKGDRALYLGDLARATADEAAGTVSIHVYGALSPVVVAASAVTVAPLVVREPVGVLASVGRLTGQ